MSSNIGPYRAETVAERGTTAFSCGRHWLWLMIVVVGAVYFFVDHDIQVSRHEQYAPWSDADKPTEAGRNIAKGLALSLIGLLGAYFVFRRDGRQSHWAGWLPVCMIGYLAWAAASTLWSVNPSLTCRHLAALMFCVAGAAGFARQFHPRDLILMAFVVTGAYFLIALATEVALGTFRPWAPGYRFAGTMHPNSQGSNLTVFCLAAFCLAQSGSRRQAWLWVLFCIGVVFLLLTKSRTSCIALAAALGVLWWLSVSGRTRLLMCLLLGLVISTSALISMLSGIDVDDKLVEVATLGRQEDLETMTGRLPIWTELASYIRARPIQGYGYAAFWNAQHIEAVSEDQQWPLREAHNAFIEATLSVGLAGTLMFLAAVLLAMRWTTRGYFQTGDQGLAFATCLLVAGLANACLESAMAMPNFTTLITGIGVMQLLFLPTPCLDEPAQATQRITHTQRLCQES